VTVLAQLPLQETTVALRRAAARDVPAIVDLLAADQLGASREGVTTDEDMQSYLTAFGVIDADPAHLLLVVTDAAQVVATMQLSFLPGLARRVRFGLRSKRCVRHDYRSRGLGAALFEWAIEEARLRKCALVQLTTDKSRTDAHRFYDRLGFVASHEGLKLKLLH
jgi:GNAT superfamily N-acetyltransferase